MKVNFTDITDEEMKDKFKAVAELIEEFQSNRGKSSNGPAETEDEKNVSKMEIKVHPIATTAENQEAEKVSQDDIIRR